MVEPELTVGMLPKAAKLEAIKHFNLQPCTSSTTTATVATAGALEVGKIPRCLWLLCKPSCFCACSDFAKATIATFRQNTLYFSYGAHFVCIKGSDR